MQTFSQPQHAFAQVLRNLLTNMGYGPAHIDIILNHTKVYTAPYDLEGDGGLSEKQAQEDAKELARICNVPFTLPLEVPANLPPGTYDLLKSASQDIGLDHYMEAKMSDELALAFIWFVAANS